MKTLFEAVKSKALEYGFEVRLMGSVVLIDICDSNPISIHQNKYHFVVVGGGVANGFTGIAATLVCLDILLSQYALNRDLSASAAKVVDSPTNTPKIAHSANGEDLEGVAEHKHNHYYKNVENLSKIDIYRVLDLFDVRSHALGHAVKKIMCAGGRGAKDHDKDIQEAIDTLVRYQQMRAEDSLGAKK